MALSCLVYVSEAASLFDDAALRSLARHAAERNRRVGITGYLHFAVGRFTQYLEGDATAVERLMSSIRRDKRHRVLAIAAEDDLSGRRFPHWGMRWVRDAEVVEIGLETILADHVVLLSRIEDVTDYRQPLWRMVDALASRSARNA